MMLRSEYRAREGMDREDAQRFDTMLSQIELRNFPIPVELCRNRDQLEVRMRVRDRSTARPIEVAMPFPIPHRSCWLSSSLDWFVYDCIKTALLHELDEAFHVGGARVRDPHKHDV